MILTVAKSTSINLRITPSFRNDLQTLADYRGLSLSSLAHSLLVKAMRQERQNDPDAFAESERKVNATQSPDSLNGRPLSAKTKHPIPHQREEVHIPKRRSK
jgi:hypothetical protein